MTATTAHTYYLGPKQTAAVLRRILRERFPNTAFSVRTGRGSGVSSVHVSWTDGPTALMVDEITKPLTAGWFDGMTDSYSYNRQPITLDGVTYEPGCRYIFTRREISPAAWLVAADTVVREQCINSGEPKNAERIAALLLPLRNAVAAGTVEAQEFAYTVARNNAHYITVNGWRALDELVYEVLGRPNR